MQPDRFTIASQEAISAAARLAREQSNPELTPAHLLAVLVGAAPTAAPAGAAGEGAPQTGVVLPVLAKLGVRLETLRAELGELLEALPKLTGGAEEEPRASSDLADVLRTAEREAQSLSDQFISTEHLLLALAEGKGQDG